MFDCAISLSPIPRTRCTSCDVDRRNACISARLAVFFASNSCLNSSTRAAVFDPQEPSGRAFTNACSLRTASRSRVLIANNSSNLASCSTAVSNSICQGPTLASRLSCKSFTVDSIRAVIASIRDNSACILRCTSSSAVVSAVSNLTIFASARSITVSLRAISLSIRTSCA